MNFTEFIKRFLVIFIISLLVLGMWFARSTLLMGFAAALIAVGISIPSGWLQRLGLRRGWAITLATIGVGLVVLFLALLVLPRLLTELFVLLGSIPEAIRSLAGVYEQVRASNEFLNAALAPIPTPDADTTRIAPERAREVLQQLVDASLAIAPSLLSGLGTVMAVIVNLVFVLFIAVFFLVDPKSYVKASLFLVPEKHQALAVNIWNELYHTIRLWISSLFLSIGITVSLVWVILGMLLGMPNALVVAVFAGLATFVPNVGAFLPLIPITIFTLASDPTQLLIYIPVYLIIQLSESNIITPAIVKAELEIPAGGLMIFQLLATLALGALGLLLAVPLLAVIIALVRELYSYTWLGLRQRTVIVDTAEAGHLVLKEPKVDQSEV